jgi:hypothetical protein
MAASHATISPTSILRADSQEVIIEIYTSVLHADQLAKMHWSVKLNPLVVRAPCTARTIGAYVDY